MKPKLKKTLALLMPIVLSVILVWYSLNKVPLDTIIDEAKKSNKYWLLLSAVLLFLSHLSRAYRWLFMLEPLGYKIRFKNSVMAVFSAYLINYGIPRSGEIARASILANYEAVPFEKGFGTIAAERVVDTIILLLIILVTLSIQFELIIQFFKDKWSTNYLYIVLGLIFLLSVLLLFIRKSKFSAVKKIKKFFLGLAEGLVSIFKMKKKWAFVIHTLIIWGLYILMFYVGTLAFNGLNGLPPSAILIGFIAGGFSIAATNGGTGGYPEAMFLAFNVFGISGNLCRAFGWVIWGTQTLMTIVLGGLALIYLPVYNKN